MIGTASELTLRFERIATKVEVVMWYTIEAAPAMKRDSATEVMLVPMSARFTFTGRDCTHLFVNGLTVKEDGTVSNNEEQFTNIFCWNKYEWPKWLLILHEKALDDFETDRKAKISS